MKPIITVGETTTPDGSKFTLHRHDGDYFLRLNGTQLMSSTWTLSERLLADYACPERAPIKVKRVLIGGLGRAVRPKAPSGPGPRSSWLSCCPK
ncbi:MAG: hypothetical protein NWQ95_05085 [Verrucomicrobiales bacterium]|nr:hypothetical protein [Verrucomicrobiales bacterium]